MSPRHLTEPYDESDGLSHLIGPDIARSDAYRLKERPPRHRAEQGRAQERTDAGGDS